MCADTKSNLESIEDFILNQDKIVTYRWLSQKLKIHPNTSKQLLYTFSLKNAEENLLVTVLISGTTEDGGFKFYVVNQSDVDKVKSSLDKIISEHVYSVQKATSYVSSSDIYLADSTADTSNKLSSISNRTVEHREFRVVLPETPVSKPVEPSKPRQEKEKIAAAPAIQGKSQAVSPTKSHKKSKESGINAFFSKQNAAKTERNEPNKEEADKQKISAENEGKSKVMSPTKGHKKAKEGGISAMFSKQAALNAEKNKSHSSKKNLDKQAKEKKEEMYEPDDEENEPDLTEEQSTKAVLKTPVNNQKKTTKSRSRKRKSKQAENNTPARKRKRIVLASDSDSDDDGNDEEEMDLEEEPEPEQPVQAEVPDSDDEVIPPTPFIEKIKRKIRKQINRTFTDEDGFICTNKEYIYESCSDEDINQEQSKGESNTEVIEKTNIIEEKLNENLKNSNNEENKMVEEVAETDTTSKAKQPEKQNKMVEEVAETDTTSKAKGKKGKIEKKPAKGKPKSPKKGLQKSNSNKQASITSFFSKK